MDVFVLPSIKEGLGLALLEAMACERPCVASNIGGISDVITDGANGILVKVADARSIADAITGLLADSGLRNRIAREGRSTVKQSFSVDSMAEKMVSLYSEVLNG
jgi:glycosyltransferase involved in cell wall biosynthesis